MSPDAPASRDRTLAGRRVVVTRARAQASELVRRLGELGAEVVELPVIAFDEPFDGGAGLAAAADRLAAGRYEWVVVTSVNAAHRLLAVLAGRTLPASVRWAAVGRSTARALMEHGVVPDLVPEIAISDALVEAFPRAGPADGTPDQDAEPVAVLFVRAETVRDVVAPGLAAKGWRVAEVAAYRTVAGDVDPGELSRARGADAVVFTSSSTVERTVALLGETGVPPLIATIGPITSEAVRAAGLRVSAEAAEHTLDGLVDALVSAVRERPVSPPARRLPLEGREHHRQHR